VHGGLDPAVVLYLHPVGEGQQLVLDRGDLAARGIFEFKRAVHRDDLRVDIEDPVAMLVGDPEVVLDGEHPLANQIAHTRKLPSSGPILLLRPDTPMRGATPAEFGCRARGPATAADSGHWAHWVIHVSERRV
jgi:hypothetical protein